MISPCGREKAQAVKIAGELPQTQARGGLVLSVEFESDESLWRVAASAFATYAQRGGGREGERPNGCW
jgi:hypothetical protein